MENDPSRIEDSLLELPLFKDVFLQMQLRNVSMVDLYLIQLEKDLFDEYVRLDRTPVPDALFVNALSQMWLFGAYELLRTWRQRVKELTSYGDKIYSTHQSERKLIIENQRKKIQKASSLLINETSSQEIDFKKIEEHEDYLHELKDSFEKIEPIFRTIEKLRVTIAKHEIPKSKGLFAQGPGYARIERNTGSMLWMIVTKDRYSEMISRRMISDKLRNI